VFLRSVDVTDELFSRVADFPDFLVIDKAPGVSVHRDREPEGLVERVAAATGHERLYLVHRLDRMTSGLLLLAKNAASCAALAELFARRRVEKYYFALSASRPQKKQGLVRGDMERTRGGSWRLCRAQTDPAVTRFFSISAAAGLRLFVLRPETGKTHQLRVAMKSLGAPVLGDSRYGGEPADRGYLHAYALRFDYRGQHICLQSQPRHGRLFAEAEVREALSRVAEPWRLPWPPSRSSQPDA